VTFSWPLPVALLTTAALSAVGFAAVAQTGDEPARVYLIGNSLTWDTIPPRLDGGDDGRVQFHVFCNRNLRFIHNRPNGHCVEESTPWPQALAEPSYDFLSIQPFAGTTLAEDTGLIADWAKAQPDATLVLHTSWTKLAAFPEAYASTDAAPDSPMQPSPAYFDALVARLQKELPGREIRTTNCHDLLDAVHQDIEAGRGPFKSLADLGRDEIHMNFGPGRYLTHNAMRRALNQSPTDEGFELKPDVKAYLDAKLAAHGWTAPADVPTPAE